MSGSNCLLKGGLWAIYWENDGAYRFLPRFLLTLSKHIYLGVHTGINIVIMPTGWSRGVFYGYR